MARRRMTTAALITITVAVLTTAAGCSTPPSTSPAAGSRAPATAAARASTPVAAATGSPNLSSPNLGATTPGAAPTGNSWEIPVLDTVPDPPRLLALPADFGSPRSVAAAYLQAWCYAPADQPANTNITNTAPWMTAAGWADDAARAVDEPTWAQTRSAGVSTICGPATASISPQAPNTPDATWVAVTAQQARVTGGAVIGQNPVSMVRRILRSPDGRWLVDVRVMAG